LRALIFLPVFLLALVNVKVNSTKITASEPLFITLTASGKNIKFPNIQKIAGYYVTSTSLTSNMVIINGEIKQTISKTYTILPESNLTIPPFEIQIDGKIEKTKPVKIEVIEPKKTKGAFTLDINLSKNSLYLGQSGILSLKFNYNKVFETLNLYPPKSNSIYLKPISKQETNNSVIYKFLLIPQKSGTHTLMAKASVGTLHKQKINDPLFNMIISDIKYKTIYSNRLKLSAKPIPKGSVFGEFNITLKANPNPQPNKPNTATLTLKGCGDFVDLKEFNINIPNATVYKHKPIIKTKIQNTKLCGTFTQRFDIISNISYTIAPISLKIFDGNKTKTISTQEIKVTIKTPKPKTSSQKKQKTPLYFIVVFFLIAILIIAYFLFTKTLYFKILTANDKKLFNILLAYNQDPYIRQTLKLLEENIYQNKQHKINKKEILKRIKRFN